MEAGTHFFLNVLVSKNVRLRTIRALTSETESTDVIRGPTTYYLGDFEQVSHHLYTGDSNTTYYSYGFEDKMIKYDKSCQEFTHKTITK